MTYHRVWGFWISQQLEKECRLWVTHFGTGRIEGIVEQRFWNNLGLQEREHQELWAPYAALTRVGQSPGSHLNPNSFPKWAAPSQRMEIAPGCPQGKSLEGQGAEEALKVIKHVQGSTATGVCDDSWEGKCPGFPVEKAASEVRKAHSAVQQPNRNSCDFLVLLNTWHGNWKTWFGKDKPISVTGN